MALLGYFLVLPGSAWSLQLRDLAPQVLSATNLTGLRWRCWWCLRRCLLLPEECLSCFLGRPGRNLMAGACGGQGCKLAGVFLLGLEVVR